MSIPRQGSVLTPIFAQLAIITGLFIISSITLMMLWRGDLAGDAAVPVAVPLFVILAGLKLVDKNIELRILDSMYTVYQVTLKSLGIVFGVLAFIPITGSVYGALFAMYLVVLMTPLNRKTVGIKVLPGGLLFLAGLGNVYPGISIETAYVFIIYAAGVLVLFYGIQYQTGKELGKGTLFCDGVEILVLILLFTAIPALIAFSVSKPLEGLFAPPQEMIITAEASAAVDATEFARLMVDVGIVVVLLVVLIVIWRKLANRDKEQQKPIEHESFAMFGRERPLNLQQRPVRSIPPSWRGKVMHVYYHFLDVLARQGAVKPIGDTPGEFTETLIQRRAAEADPLNRLTDLFQLARYSVHSIEEQEYEKAKQAAADLEHALKTKKANDDMLKA